MEIQISEEGEPTITLKVTVSEKTSLFLSRLLEASVYAVEKIARGQQ